MDFDRLVKTILTTWNNLAFFILPFFILKLCKVKHIKELFKKLKNEIEKSLHASLKILNNRRQKSEMIDHNAFQTLDWYLVFVYLKNNVRFFNVFELFPNF